MEVLGDDEILDHRTRRMAFLKRQRTKPAFMLVLSDIENKSPPIRTTFDLCRSKYHSYAKWMSHASRRIFTGLNMADLPSEEEIISQGQALCHEYIYSRLKKHGLMGHRSDMHSSSSIPHPSDVSREIQMIGGELEKMYPDLYHNISKQLNIPMTSEATVVRTFKAVSEQLFKSGITWGRIVAVFCLAGAFATDCVQQDHAHFVTALVDAFTDVVSQHLVEWIIRQGGWIDIIRTFRTTKEAPAVWFLSVAGALFGFVLTILATVQV